MKQRLSGALVSVVITWATLAALVPAASPASAAPLAHPVVLAVSATPRSLPPTGGTVVVRGRVEHAASCQLELLSRQSFAVVYSHNPTTACRDGTFSAHVTIGRNPTSVQRSIAFSLTARNGTSSFAGRFYVVLGAALPARILTVFATPATLPAGGGSLEVIGSVEHATSCQLQLLSHQSFPVVYSHSPTSNCRGGSYSAHIVIGANPSPLIRTVAFALVARNQTSAFTGRFYLTLTAPMPRTTTTTVLPLIVLTSFLPDGSVGVPYFLPLRASGGAVPYSWHAQGLPPGLRLTSHGVVTGTPTQAGGFDVTVAVVDTRGRQNTASMTMVIGGGPTTTTTGLATTTTTVPPMTTTTLPATTTTSTSAAPSVVQEASSNWSGYAVTGGPFSVVSGTFTASRLVDGTPATGVMAEWVGIDGQPGTSGANDLIQAGILESMDPCQGAATNPSGPYNPNEFYICPWTFFIENGQASEGPLPQVTVDAGDSLTVEIWQQSGTSWAVSLTDNTSGQSWSVGNQYYAGPAASAEWIVEDPGDPSTPCGQTGPSGSGQCPPIASYSPPVSFSKPGLTPGSVSTWYEISLVQGGVQVSTPSALSENGSTVAGFSVSYTAT